MKKTLAALIIGAFAASAANAAVLYDNEGTKIELNGSLRINLEKSNQGGQASQVATGATTKAKRRTHSGLKNDGSRFEIKATHQLGDGYYALARTEVRFDSEAEARDGFGDLTTKRAYIGLGHKALGQVTFGRQVTIADDLVVANDYTYGIIDKGEYITKEGKSVIRYDYEGIDGLQLGVGYQFAEDRGNTKTGNNEVEAGKVSNSTQFGALYNKDGIIAKLAFGRTNYQTTTTATGQTGQKHRDGVLASFGYEFAGATVSLDGGYARTKFAQTDKKETRFFVSPGFQYKITDLSKVYGNYKYEQVKKNTDAKDKTHGVLLGVDYKLHKQVVTYLEGKYQVTKSYDANGNYKDGSKVKDKAIGVGVRVFF